MRAVGPCLTTWGHGLDHVELCGGANTPAACPQPLRSARPLGRVPVPAPRHVPCQRQSMLCVALQKLKEHNLETWALFIDLVKAFDTVSREALFAVLRKFGMPDHFICIVMRLHTGAVMKFKIGEIDSTVPSEIGVRQGSCEGPTLFLFIMQAALETMS